VFSLLHVIIDDSVVTEIINDADLIEYELKAPRMKKILRKVGVMEVSQFLNTDRVKKEMGSNNRSKRFGSAAQAK
jgi:predicted nucleic acid-binding Zn ribbon protein